MGSAEVNFNLIWKYPRLVCVIFSFTECLFSKGPFDAKNKLLAFEYVFGMRSFINIASVTWSSSGFALSQKVLQA